MYFNQNYQLYRMLFIYLLYILKTVFTNREQIGLIPRSFKTDKYRKQVNATCFMLLSYSKAKTQLSEFNEKPYVRT